MLTSNRLIGTRTMTRQVAATPAATPAPKEAKKSVKDLPDSFLKGKKVRCE